MSSSLRLTDLPSEIASLIVDAIDDPQDFCACIATCSWFRVPPGSARLVGLFHASSEEASLLTGAPSTRTIRSAITTIRKVSGSMRRPDHTCLFRWAGRLGRVDVMDWIWEHKRYLLEVNHRLDRLRDEGGHDEIDIDRVWRPFCDAFCDACLGQQYSSVQWFMRNGATARIVHNALYTLAQRPDVSIPFFAHVHAVLQAEISDCASLCAVVAERARCHANLAVWAWLQANCPGSVCERLSNDPL
nr:hypothetical protein [Pandoravirus massiliensis]